MERQAFWLSDITTEIQPMVALNSPVVLREKTRVSMRMALPAT